MAYRDRRGVLYAQGIYTKTLPVRMEPAMWAWLRDYAHAYNCSTAEAVRTFIEWGKAIVEEQRSDDATVRRAPRKSHFESLPKRHGVAEE